MSANDNFVIVAGPFTGGKWLGTFIADSYDPKVARSVNKWQGKRACRFASFLRVAISARRLCFVLRPFLSIFEDCCKRRVLYIVSMFASGLLYFHGGFCNGLLPYFLASVSCMTVGRIFLPGVYRVRGARAPRVRARGRRVLKGIGN